MSKKIIITQSNYIPWKGYFDGLALVDEFVIYDDMQYTKRDWRNRNLIKTPQGLKWLTIPVEVKGKYFQKINEALVSDKNWTTNHLNQIKQNYKTAPCFKEVFPWLEDVYLKCNFDKLTEINQYFIEAINNYLNIKVTILRSEQFVLAEDRSERLLNICLERNATDYYSGPAAKAYMNEELFHQKGVRIHYFDYSNYPTYHQLHGNFEHGVSIIDLLLNEGKNSCHFLKYTAK
jgi:hypothetical protein